MNGIKLGEAAYAVFRAVARLRAKRPPAEAIEILTELANRLHDADGFDERRRFALEHELEEAKAALTTAKAKSARLTRLIRPGELTRLLRLDEKIKVRQADVRAEIAGHSEVAAEIENELRQLRHDRRALNEERAELQAAKKAVMSAWLEGRRPRRQMAKGPSPAGDLFNRRIENREWLALAFKDGSLTAPAVAHTLKLDPSKIEAILAGTVTLSAGAWRRLRGLAEPPSEATLRAIGAWIDD